MKKSILVMVLVMALLLSACGGTPAAKGATPQNPVTFQIGFVSAEVETDPYFVTAKTIKTLVEERTKGAVKIDIKGGSQLGGEREMIEGIQTGTVDMTVTTNAMGSNVVPASGLFDLPFVFPTREKAAEVLDGPIGKAVLEEYSKFNMKALAWGEGGFRHLVLKSDPVRKPEDMQGLKIRCMETQSYIDAYKFMGSNAVPMAWPEVITALQQNTIDGLDIPISVIYSNGFPKIVDYVALTGHFYSPLPILIANASWAKLNAEQQAIVQQAAVEAGQASRAHNAAMETKMIKEMEDGGLTIIKDVDLAAFQKNFSQYYIERKDKIGGTYVEDLLAALK